MHYTISGNIDVDAKIRADLDYISGRVEALLGDRLHSILLCGGFGRGEGSVVYEDGEVHIVNDYDFTVVLNAKNRLHYLKLYREIHGPLEDLAVELAKELNIKQVDLSPKPLTYFTGKQQLKIENYEVKSGHVLIHGVNDPTDSMPAWRPQDIPLFEGTWLFRNRGAGMLLAALYFLAADQIPEAKKENFVIECTKAQLAMGDAVLLLKNSYHHLYRKRYEILDSLDISDIPTAEIIKSMYREGLDQKLNPNFEKYRHRNLRQWWFEVRKYYEKFFTYYEQQRLKKQFGTWLEYAELPKPEDRLDLKTLAVKTVKLGRAGFSMQKITGVYRRSRKSFTISLVALLLFSLRKDGFDTGMLDKAANILDLQLSGKPKRDWLFLTKAALTEIHPGGEVATVLAAMKT